MAKQPEALATFAASARNDSKKSSDISLVATPETDGVTTDPAKKVDAATKVLRDGVLHKNQGADEAVDRLPDRVTARKPS